MPGSSGFTSNRLNLIHISPCCCCPWILMCSKKKKKKADWYMLHSKLISSRKKGTRPRYLIDEELGGFFLPLNVLNLAKVILKFFKWQNTYSFKWQNPYAMRHNKPGSNLVPVQAPTSVFRTTKKDFSHHTYSEWSLEATMSWVPRELHRPRGNRVGSVAIGYGSCCIA